MIGINNNNKKIEMNYTSAYLRRGQRELVGRSEIKSEEAFLV